MQILKNDGCKSVIVCFLKEERKMNQSGYPMHGSVHVTPGWYIVSTPSRTAKVPILSHPTINVKIIAQLPANCRVEVMGQDGLWLQIKLPDTRTGYIAASSVMPAQISAYPSSSPTNIAGSKFTPETVITQSGVERGCRMGVAMIFLLIGVPALGIGIFLTLLEQESCPFGANAYSSSCTVLSRPYADTGIILIIVGAVALMLMLIIAIASRSARKR
jgi:hypothetical protein